MVVLGMFYSLHVDRLTKLIVDWFRLIGVGGDIQGKILAGQLNKIVVWTKEDDWSKGSQWNYQN